MSAMESVRVRLQFEDRRILRKSQRKEGLQRSWIMLKPDLRTVSDLAYHVLHAFGLQESCPHGLILSMDGFVLPSFESTSVLKDTDVVWVKRKEQSSMGNGRLCGGKNSMEALEIADKQPVNKNLLLVAKEEFIKETGGYESESEEDQDENKPSSDNNSAENAANEDADSKKRKASRKLKSPKRKKSKLAHAEESLAACRDAGNEAAKKEGPHNDKPLLKDGQLENKSSHSKGKNDAPNTSKNTRELSGYEEAAAKMKATVSPAACGDAGNEESAVKMSSPQDDRAFLKDSQLEKNKSSHSKGRNNVATTSKTDGKVSVSSQSTPQEKSKGSVDASLEPSEAKKLPSRSARRKKLKRQWLREMRKIGEEGQRRQSTGDDDWRKKFLGNHEKTLAFQDDNRKLEEHQQHQQSHISTAAAGAKQPHHDNSSSDMIVPIEIRPGHIRFEPLDEDADRPVQKSSVTVTTFQWNGVTDKKRGQKWGKEKVAAKWNDNGYQKTKRTDNGYNTTKWTDNNNYKTKWTVSGSQNNGWTDNNCQRASWNSSQNPDQGPPQEASQEQTHPNDSTDFTKLLPYGPVPQEGDIVAYRVIELSSSWTPEVSPFRVGKISSCNQGSKKIRLVPVPEHPFDLEKTDKALYGEDGSLEVDFTSLIDVRSLNPNKSESAITAGGQINGTTGGESTAVTGAQEDNKNEGNQAQARENGGANVWEEITQALSAKKAQLSQEDRWKRKESSAAQARGPPSSSYRGLRGSALGPIMALLRAQNAML